METPSFTFIYDIAEYMKNGYLIGYTWIVVAVLAVIFVIAKFAMIKTFRLTNLLPRLFIRSLQNSNRHIIEHTEEKALKQYLKMSNIANIVFYLAGLFFILVYIFFTYTI